MKTIDSSNMSTNIPFSIAIGSMSSLHSAPDCKLVISRISYGMGEVISVFVINDLPSFIYGYRSISFTFHFHFLLKNNCDETKRCVCIVLSVCIFRMHDSSSKLFWSEKINISSVDFKCLKVSKSFLDIIWIL